MTTYSVDLCSTPQRHGFASQYVWATKGGNHYHFRIPKDITGEERKSRGQQAPLPAMSHTGIYPQLGIYHSFLHHHVDLLSLHLLT